MQYMQIFNLLPSRIPTIQCTCIHVHVNVHKATIIFHFYKNKVHKNYIHVHCTSIVEHIESGSKHYNYYIVIKTRYIHPLLNTLNTEQTL